MNMCHGNVSGLLVVKNKCPALAAPYVKVYLLDNGACIAKKKTKVARKTLEPLYQQTLAFEESPGGKVLQVQVTECFLTWLARFYRYLPKVTCYECALTWLARFSIKVQHGMNDD